MVDLSFPRMYPEMYKISYCYFKFLLKWNIQCFVIRTIFGYRAILFNLYGEYLMKEALAEAGDFNKLRFPDDTAIIAIAQEELLVQHWKKVWHENHPELIILNILEFINKRLSHKESRCE